MRKAKVSLRNFTSTRVYLFIIGISATLWFLVRVIPKPSRARYPCMQVAAPLMSSFVIYLLGITASWVVFKKFRKYFKRSRYLLASVLLGISVSTVAILFLIENEDVFAKSKPLDTSFPVASNSPIGVALGLNPGRVVWVHDADATNENYVPEAGSDDFWYSNSNADEDVIKNMLALSIKTYAGIDELDAAWEAIFTSFNSTHDRGEVGYQPGEKIAFKINLTNQGSSDRERPQRMDVAPQLLNAILEQLVNVVGVQESDIILGDPYREFRQEYVELVKNKFPDVYYVDGNGGNGIHPTVPSSEEALVFSDKENKSTLPQQFIDATYVINIPALKSHNEGGITLIAKNHQGSYLQKGDDPGSQYAIKMHYSLPKNSPGTGKYRHTVDYMGHKDTGGKGLIYIIDGLWGGESWEGWIKKFKSDPFNNDYPNSLFVGQDPVALESVCFDVLFQEYAEDPEKQSYPIEMKVEVADYLSQCASSDYWPDGISYDPEGDGTPIGSLGVFEHWNNSSDREYSRNLGTGNGIELNYIDVATIAVHEKSIHTIQIASPNPFNLYTQFARPADVPKESRLEIYTIKGQKVRSFDFSSSDVVTWSGNDRNGISLPDGIYFYSIVDSGRQVFYSGKVVLNR